MNEKNKVLRARTLAFKLLQLRHQSLLDIFRNVGEEDEVSKFTQQHTADIKSLTNQHDLLWTELLESKINRGCLCRGVVRYKSFESMTITIFSRQAVPYLGGYGRFRLKNTGQWIIGFIPEWRQYFVEGKEADPGRVYQWNEVTEFKITPYNGVGAKLYSGS